MLGAGVTVALRNLLWLRLPPHKWNFAQEHKLNCWVFIGLRKCPSADALYPTPVKRTWSMEYKLDLEILSESWNLKKFQDTNIPQRIECCASHFQSGLSEFQLMHWELQSNSIVCWPEYWHSSTSLILPRETLHVHCNICTTSIQFLHILPNEMKSNIKGFAVDLASCDHAYRLLQNQPNNSAKCLVRCRTATCYFT